MEIWIYDKLKNDIGDKRYNHSVRVMNTSIQLAKAYNFPVDKAAMAGLLHDCGKFKEEKKILKYVKNFDIILDNVMENNIGLVHGSVGSELAEVIYNVEDEDVLNAIRFHTTGRENMSLLEKVVYIADVIEPGRDYTGIEEIRAMAYKDIDKSLILSLNRTIKFIIDRGNLIHLDTIRARNYLVKS